MKFVRMNHHHHLLMMTLLLMALPFSLTADKFNLYAGRPQSLTIQNLKPESKYLWELRTAHDRVLANGQLQTDEKGNLTIILEVPAIEDGSIINTELRLVLYDVKSVNHGLTFHSAKVFGDDLSSIVREGVYASSDSLRNSLDLTGIKAVDRDMARVFLLEDASLEEVNRLVAKGKMVVFFADGDNEVLPPRGNLTVISLEVVARREQPSNLSVVYNKSDFVISYDGNGGIVDLTYRKGRLVVVAPQLRRSIDKNPETWLVLKRKIKEEAER